LSQARNFFLRRKPERPKAKHSDKGASATVEAVRESVQNKVSESSEQSKSLG